MRALLGSLSKRTESRGLKRYLHTCLHSSVIHSSQEVETMQVFTRNGQKERDLMQANCCVGDSTDKGFRNFVFPSKSPFPGGLRKVTCRCWALVSVS